MNITKSAVAFDSDFKIAMPIVESFTKSVQREDADGNLVDVDVRYVRGLASGTSIDRDGERMAKSAIEAFKKAIDEGIISFNGEQSLVPLTSGHREEWDDILGWIVEADIDKNHDLWITAELKDSSKAQDLYKDLTSPRKAGRPVELGFSVGGKIKKASRLWDATSQASVVTFEDVALKHVSVVGKPSYAKSYVEALMKSVAWEDVPEEQPMTVSEEAVVKTETTLETPNEEVVKETTEESPSEEVVTTDPYAEKFEAINAQIAQISETLALLVPQNADKSVTEEVETDVQKETESNEEQIDVVKAIDDRFATFTSTVINPITEQLGKLAGAIGVLAEQSVDKSISVRQDKEELTDADRFVQKYAGKTAENINRDFFDDFVKAAIVSR